MNRISHAKSSPKAIRFVACLLILVVTGTLAGCTTLTPEQQRAEDQRICMSYGFKPKTDALANCLLQIHLDRRADIRAWQNDQPQFLTPAVIYQPVLIRR